MIIWGTKRVERVLGYVADFCPICRDQRNFKVTRIGMAGHVYYLSFGEGELAGYTRSCMQCRTELVAKPDDYKSLSKSMLTPAELLAQTLPDYARVYAARLELERSLRNPLARIDPNERAALIKEPFILLSPRVERRFASMHFDGPTLLAALGGFVGMPVGIALVEALLPGLKEGAPLFFLAAWVVALAVTGFRAGGRWLRREIYPPLAGALRPLKPTPAELEGALRDMKTLGRKIGSKVKLADLLAAMQAQGPAPAAAVAGARAL